MATLTKGDKDWVSARLGHFAYRLESLNTELVRLQQYMRELAQFFDGKIGRDDAKAESQID